MLTCSSVSCFDEKALEAITKMCKAVHAEKNLEGRGSFPKFCNYRPNLDFLVPFFTDLKKIFPKFKVKTKKSLYFESVFDFTIFVPKP